MSSQSNQRVMRGSILDGKLYNNKYSPFNQYGFTDEERQEIVENVEIALIIKERLFEKTGQTNYITEWDINEIIRLVTERRN